MKKAPIIYIVIAIIGCILIGMLFRPKEVQIPNPQVGNELWNILQTFLDADHQSMKVDASICIGEEEIELSSKIYHTKVNDVNYLVFEQEDFPIYVVDNMLLLENGKAFKITDQEVLPEEDAEKSPVETDNLFQQVISAYKEFKFTTKQVGEETYFDVVVTGKLVDKLLGKLIPMEQAMIGKVESLQMTLVIKDDNIAKMELKSDSLIDEKKLKVDIALSAFQIMKEGEYSIPDAVKDSVKNVNQDDLFCISRDLYPLLKASKSFEKLADKEGTVRVVVNFGEIQIDNTSSIEALRTGTDKVENSTEVQKMPEWISTLFMEGEIKCEVQEEKYKYILSLDKAATKKISQILVPNLEKYRVSFTKGETTLTVHEDEVTTITIAIDGMVDIFINEIPIGIKMEYNFQ